MVRGVVLAAGRSRRMGEPKALLPVAGQTFVRRAIGALLDGGCAAVSVVVAGDGAPEALRIAAEARAAGAEVVEAAGGGEQVDSLRTALRGFGPEVDAAVVLPVDHPRVEGALVRALIGAFGETGAPVVVPSHGGRHGHPVLFARRTFAALLDGPLPEGARSVVHAHAGELVEVPVADAEMLEDVDTPADFRRVVRGAE